MINVIKKSSTHRDIKSHEFFSDKSPQQGGRIFSLIIHHSIFMISSVTLFSLGHTHMRTYAKHTEKSFLPRHQHVSDTFFGFVLIASSCYISRTGRSTQHKNVLIEKKKILSRMKSGKKKVTISVFFLHPIIL